MQKTSHVRILIVLMLLFVTGCDDDGFLILQLQYPDGVSFIEQGESHVFPNIEWWGSTNPCPIEFEIAGTHYDQAFLASLSQMSAVGQVQHQHVPATRGNPSTHYTVVTIPPGAPIANGGGNAIVIRDGVSAWYDANDQLVEIEGYFDSNAGDAIYLNGHRIAMPVDESTLHAVLGSPLQKIERSVW